METNPAYGVAPRPESSNIYDQINPECVQNICYQTPASVQEKPSKEADNEERKINIMVATSLIAMVVALVMSLIAVITVAALYNPILNNANHESQLQLLRAELREMLNQIECESSSLTCITSRTNACFSSAVFQHIIA